MVKTTVIPITLIAISVTAMSVMIVFGQIDFFDEMTCDELDMFISHNITDGKYPFETIFTPSQIENLKYKYNENCI